MPFVAVRAKFTNMKALYREKFNKSEINLDELDGFANCMFTYNLQSFWDN